jgi:predicted nucleotidyltransferase
VKHISRELLEEVSRRICEAVQPEKIIIFGSHAWGSPTEASDLDLFVIVSASDQPSYRRSRALYKSLRGLKVPVDLVVRTSEEVEQSKTVATSLDRKVLEEGRVLHG